MENITKAFAAITGAVLSFFVGLPPIMWVLIAVMTLDYATGLICGAMGKSLKTENGGLSSSAAFSGLLKKGMILVVVALAALLDWAVATGADVSFNAVTGATCLWFVASEGVSIIENATEIGIPIPTVLQQALEIMKGGMDDES